MTEVIYKCNNCNNFWNTKGTNCQCYIKASDHSKNLWKVVKERLGCKNSEFLDSDIFLNNLTDEERKERIENNELFRNCGYDNSIKNVVVKTI